MARYGQRIPGGLWVPMMANYFRDTAVRRAGAKAELVFVRSLAQSKSVDENGVLSPEQLKQISHGIYDFRGQCARLVAENLWTYDEETGNFAIRSWAKYNGAGADAEAEEKAKAQARERQRRHRERPTTFGVTRDVTPGEKRREERVEVTDRTPSGSVRSVTASAAQRVAGGAAQQPLAEVVDSEPVDAATVADTKKKMQELIAASKMATGRPVKMVGDEWSAARNAGGERK